MSIPYKSYELLVLNKKTLEDRQLQKRLRTVDLEQSQRLKQLSFYERQFKRRYSDFLNTNAGNDFGRKNKVNSATNFHPSARSVHRNSYNKFIESRSLSQMHINNLRRDSIDSDRTASTFQKDARSQDHGITENNFLESHNSSEDFPITIGGTVDSMIKQFEGTKFNKTRANCLSDSQFDEECNWVKSHKNRDLRELSERNGESRRGVSSVSNKHRPYVIRSSNSEQRLSGVNDKHRNKVSAQHKKASDVKHTTKTEEFDKTDTNRQHHYGARVVNKIQSGETNKVLHNKAVNKRPVLDRDTENSSSYSMDSEILQDIKEITTLLHQNLMIQDIDEDNETQRQLPLSTSTTCKPSAGSIPRKANKIEGSISGHDFKNGKRI